MTEGAGPAQRKRDLHALQKLCALLSELETEEERNPGAESEPKQEPHVFNQSDRMTVPSVRQLCVLSLLWCLGCWSASDASPYSEWEDGLQLRKVRDLQNPEINDYLWRDPNEEQVQNVFKRFLFHYSKARNSVGALQQETQSVHPLMRLSPKLGQRKKKVLLLIRELPEEGF